jgi:hypothetical protein
MDTRYVGRAHSCSWVPAWNLYNRVESAEREPEIIEICADCVVIMRVDRFFREGESYAVQSNHRDFCCCLSLIRLSSWMM